MRSDDTGDAICAAFNRDSVYDDRALGAALRMSRASVDRAIADGGLPRPHRIRSKRFWTGQVLLTHFGGAA
jgi:hypothetical protein